MELQLKVQLLDLTGGSEPLKCGGTSGGEITNASLMRILPVAFIDGIDYATVENVSSITHAHEICKIACVLYIEIAKSMMSEDLEIQEHLEKSCDKIKEYYHGSGELNNFHRIFKNNLDDVESSFLCGWNFGMCSSLFLTTSSYKEAVLKAVNFGNDTDTVGAICGGLAGIYYGYDSIPSNWIM